MVVTGGLADDWQALRIAGWDIDGTTWGSRASVEGKSLATVVVVPV